MSKPTVLKMEIMGFRLVEETAKAWIVEAGAGEARHDRWQTLRQGYPGLENMALIPGTVGASPVQIIGAKMAWSCKTDSSRWMR